MPKNSRKTMFRENELISFHQNGGGWSLKYNTDEEDTKGPESISGALYNLAQESAQGVTRIGSVIGESAIENMSRTGEAVTKVGLLAVDKYMDWTIDATLGNEINNKTIEEKLADTAAEVAKDPEAKKAMKQTGKVIGDLMVNVIDTARAPLKQATGRAIDIANDVGGETLSGATKFSVDMVSVVASEIPVLGGIVDLTIAVGRAFNSGMKAFRKGTGNAIEVGEIMNKLISEIIPKIDTSVDSGIEVKHTLEGITKRITASINSTSNAINDVSTGVRSNIDDIAKNKEADKDSNKQQGGRRRKQVKGDDIIDSIFKLTKKRRVRRAKKTRRTKK
jgi:hypothetical protein